MDTAVLKGRGVGQQIDDRLPLHEWLGGIGSDDVFRTELSGAKRAAILVSEVQDEAAEKRLHNWQIAAALNHPHLLRIFECGRAHIDGSEIIYIVTEMPEEALGQILPERPLTAFETREMLTPVLDALAFLHGEGLVHGSLEPANILVVGEQLKLSPYTIQAAGPSIAGERGGGLYDAPETELGLLTPAADLWSLGVTIVEALTQHRPSWVRDSGRDPLVPATVPQPFAEIARRCLQFDPTQRCTLAEIRSLLAGAVAVPAPATASSAATAAPQKPQQLPLAYETHEGTSAPSRPQLRKSLRALEDDEPRRPFPLVYLFGGAAFLFLLIVGILAYSHRSKPTLAPPPDDSSTAAPATKEPKALPQPSGPTVKGEVAQRVTPEIPERAARGIRGKVEVTIKVAVDHSGNVMNASVVSEGRSRYFANLALESARKWRFHPAKIHGQAASSTWDLHWVFRPNGTEVTPTEITP